MNQLTSIAYCLPVLLILAGCGPSWSSRFPIGTRLYENPDHRYFGRVVGYESAHDFHNGTGKKPSILIEQADGGGNIWGECETCADSLQVELP